MSNLTEDLKLALKSASIQGLLTVKNPADGSIAEKLSTAQPDHLYIQVNDVGDVDPSAIDFKDNKITLREAIYISQSQSLESGDTVYIDFVDSPKGDMNQEDLPPWLIYLDASLPPILKGNIHINTNKTKSIILAPRRDNGIDQPLKFHAEDLSRPLDAPFESIDAMTGQVPLLRIGSNDKYRSMLNGFLPLANEDPSLKVTLDRVNFIRNTIKFKFRNSLADWRSEGNQLGMVTYPGLVGSAGLDILSGNITIKNSIFQNLSLTDESTRIPVSVKGSGFGGAMAYLADPNKGTRLSLENVKFNDNNASYTNKRAFSKIDRHYKHDIQVHNRDSSKNIYLKDVFFGSDTANQLSSFDKRASYPESFSTLSDTPTLFPPARQSTSYLYKSDVADLADNQTLILTDNLPDTLTIDFDRPTKGALSIFSDFSNLIGEVQSLNSRLAEVVEEVITTREAGIDPMKHQEAMKEAEEDAKLDQQKLEHDKTMAWVNMGTKMLSQVIGMDIKEAIPDGDGGAKLRSSKYNTRTAIFNQGTGTQQGTGSQLTSRQAFSEQPGQGKSAANRMTKITKGLSGVAFAAGFVMNIVNTANKIGALDQKIKQRQEQLDEELEVLEELKQKSIANKNELDQKMDDYQSRIQAFNDGDFDPYLHLSVDTIKQQRKPVLVEKFKLGEDIIIIPRPGKNATLEFSHIADNYKSNDGQIVRKTGFSVSVLDQDSQESAYVVAKVYVDPRDFTSSTDFGTLITNINFRDTSKQNSPWVIGQGYFDNQIQTKMDSSSYGPVHTNVILDRNQEGLALKDIMNTKTDVGHDSIKGTDGDERIHTYRGSDIVSPGLGHDTVDTMKGVDAVLFSDLKIPIQITGKNQNDSSYYTVLPTSQGQNKPRLQTTLKNVEIIKAPADSQLNMKSLPDPHETNAYKFMIRQGTSVQGSQYNDLIEFELPSVLLNEQGQFNSISAITVNGESGEDHLDLIHKPLPSGVSLLSVPGTDTQSGTIYLRKTGSQDLEIANYSGVSTSLDAVPFELNPGTALLNVADPSADVDVPTEPSAGDSSSSSSPSAFTFSFAGDFSDFDDETSQSSQFDVPDLSVLHGSKNLKDESLEHSPKFISSERYPLRSPLTMNGSTGDDQIYGASADDHISGFSGHDRLFGYGANDHIEGGRGKDLIMGGSGSDSLNGGPGSDYLIGDAGDDTLVGGDGKDTYIVRRHQGSDLILDFNPEDDLLVILARKAKKISRDLKIVSRKEKGGHSSLIVHFNSDHCEDCFSIHLQFDQKANIDVSQWSLKNLPIAIASPDQNWPDF